MGIKKDLKIGADGEQLVLDIFNNMSFKTGKNIKKDKLIDFDIWAGLNIMDGDDVKLAYFTIEIKNDIYAERSGNIAIEFFNTNKCKASGISVTKANLWAHIIPNNGIYLTSVSKLTEYINNNTPLRTVFNAGDGNANIYLYPMDKILPAIFTKIDNLSCKKLKTILKQLL